MKSRKNKTHEQALCCLDTSWVFCTGRNLESTARPLNMCGGGGKEATPHFEEQPSGQQSQNQRSVWRANSCGRLAWRSFNMRPHKPQTKILILMCTMAVWWYLAAGDVGISAHPASLKSYITKTAGVSMKCKRLIFWSHALQNTHRYTYKHT